MKSIQILVRCSQQLFKQAPACISYFTAYYTASSTKYDTAYNTKYYTANKLFGVEPEVNFEPVSFQILLVVTNESLIKGHTETSRDNLLTPL